MRAAMAAMMGAASRSKAFFADDFNRANGSLGSSWTTVTGSPAINTNRLQGTFMVVWAADTYTDDQFVQVTLGANLGGTLYLHLRNPAGWPQVAATLTPSSGAWTIYTDPTSGAGNHTNRVTGSVGSGVWVTGGVPRFEAAGNVYTLKYNGVAVPSATWTDSGAVVVPGPTKRKVGVQIVPSGTFNVDDFVGGDL